ncbi:hypothetical protein H4R18_003759 [Coemansia javaensis]|uniref:C2H2-type domain-containing protein n=1 Tax=Coemansia javaensis TaxID=2761396 RepID=A0A9W8LI26_9FUNG|nr:hypothetical protein H4R18_003759 [Coemansia javaensis]
MRGALPNLASPPSSTMSVRSVYASAVAKLKARVYRNNAYVCFYCGAEYYDQDDYNTHVEVMHYHER